VKLSRLTQIHTLDDLRGGNTAAHADLFDLNGGLAKRQASAADSAEYRRHA
jgi:hypothetical protein